MQSPSHIPVERKKAANVSSFVHSAQHLPDEFVTERGIAGQERGLESFLERRQEAALIELPLLAQQGEAFINSEFQMRLTRNSGYESLSTDDQTRLASSLLLANSYPSSEIDPSEILSRTALTRVSHQDQLSRSILTGHSPQDRFVQQIWARDLASSMTATVPRVGVLDQMDALSNLRARILAQSLGEAARTQQVESVARLGSHLSTDVAYFSPSRMLNQPAIEAISSRAADPAFDLSLSLMAQHDESRSVPLLSSRSRSANPFDSAQLGASVSGDHSEPSQTEQLLQLYLLQQQQRRQQDRPP